MSSKVFIAAPRQDVALEAKALLESQGHRVASTWHDRAFSPTADMTDDERNMGADRNTKEVLIADAVLLLVRPGLVPGGSYIEAGIAIGCGMPVLAVGTREDGTRGNFNLYGSLVSQFSDVTSAIQQIDTLVEEYITMVDIEDDDAVDLDEFEDDEIDDDDDDLSEYDEDDDDDEDEEEDELDDDFDEFDDEEDED